jgi:hypothetical protein
MTSSSSSQNVVLVGFLRLFGSSWSTSSSMAEILTCMLMIVCRIAAWGENLDICAQSCSSKVAQSR